MPVADGKEAASELLHELILLLAAEEARYVFPRNYEGYPETLTGDIDIMISREDFQRVQPRFEALFARAGWKAFRKLQRPYVMVYQLFTEAAAAQRKFLVIEFFFGFTWMGFDYLDFNACWQRRVQIRNFSALDPLDAILTTVLHYFFWCGFLPRKYVPRLHEQIGSGDPARFKERLAEHYPENLADALYSVILRLPQVPDEGWKKETNFFEPLWFFPRKLRTQYKRHAVLRRFRSCPVSTAALAYRLIASDFHDRLAAQGAVLFLIGNQAEAIATEVLKQAKAFHLYKNKSSAVVGVTDVASAQIRISRILRRGGLAVVPLLHGEGAGQRLVKESPRQHSFLALVEAGPPLEGPKLLSSEPMPSGEQILETLIKNNASDRWHGN